jgi:hypothetical protein
MDIKRWEGNHVKSEASERRVPIHPILIELGLLKLVELRRQQGQSRLFPHLKRGAVKGKFSESSRRPSRGTGRTTTSTGPGWISTRSGRPATAT